MIRPIDLQDNFSKAPMAAREQHLQQTRPELAQHNIARQQDQDHILDHSRVRPGEDADASENRLDDHEGNQRQGKRRQPKTGTATPKDDEQAPPRPQLKGALYIDVTA